MNKRLQVLKYVVADFFSAVIAWGAFFIYRKYSVDPNIFKQFELVLVDPKLYMGLAIVPVFWFLLYIIMGTYRKIYRKSRLKELEQTLMISVIGVLFIFFALILDDIILSYKSYYQSFLFLFPGFPGGWFFSCPGE